MAVPEEMFPVRKKGKVTGARRKAAGFLFEYFRVAKMPWGGGRSAAE